MNQINELDPSSLLRDQSQNQINDLSKDDPFYSILSKQISRMPTWKAAKMRGKKIEHLQIT